MPDFSYSLYILHFPLMLFVFFLTCQLVPSEIMDWVLVAGSLAISFAVSIGSGMTFERLRFWLRY